MKNLASAILEGRLDESQLVQLADILANKKEGPLEVRKTPAGNTYIGQMIAHDIVRSTNRKNVRGNFSPFLNLDSIYWDNEVKHLYVQTNGKFKLSSDFGVDIYSKLDIPRNSSGEPLIPDIRNDVNVIVSQLHAFWIRLHNKLIDKKLASDYYSAKNIVIKLFQLVVIVDFLPEVLNEEVYNIYFKKGKTLFNEWDKKTTPLFFSHAAFRFGHSLVRAGYVLKKQKDEDLMYLFRFGKPLEKRFEIDWNQFFVLQGHNRASQIDTRIVTGMKKVDFPPTSNTDINPIYLNLKAAEEINLPSGFVFASLIKQCQRQIKIKIIDDLAETRFSAIQCENKRLVTAQQLPLWPYILLEAELNTENKLGNVGSILIAEVIHNAIKGSNVSVLQRNGRIKDKDGFGLPKKLIIEIGKASDLNTGGDMNQLLNTATKKSFFIMLDKFLNYKES